MAPNRKRRGKRLPPSTAGSLTPTLTLSRSTVTLAATADDTATVQAIVTAQSGNGGALGGVGLGTIVEDNGSGWLSASVQGAFPALITVVCDPTGLTADTYTGTVPVTDQRASNSPRNITVTFTVAASVVPSIVLSNPTMTLSVQQGNAATTDATCIVTSGTAAALGPLTVGTVTGTGSTGISAAIVGNVVTVTGASAALTNASSPYTATVPIVDATASNSPQNITVTLNVAAVSPPPTPTMALSASAITLSAVQGSGAVASTTVTVTSANGASLGTTSVGTITGTGAAAVTTSVSGHVVTINAAVGSLAVASYSATIPVLDSLASNSPQNVTLTFNVTAQPVGTTIPAAIHLFDDTAGSSVLVSAPFPLRPGDMSDADAAAGKIRVYVNGVEQSVYSEALRGRHNDGTVRAMLLQFRYDIPNTTPITASVVLGTARGTTDMVKVPVTQGVIYNLATSPYGVKAKLLPTDVSYLCASQVAGIPLSPKALDAPEVSQLAGPYFDNRFEALKSAEATNSSATSDYEHVRALVAQWCRTGETKFYTNALSRARYMIEYNMPAASNTGYNPNPNIEGLSTAGTVQPNETKSQRFWTYFTGYYLTGWGMFYTINNAQSQQGLRAAQSGTYVRSSTENPRFNTRDLGAIYLSALMDATRPMSNPSGGSVPVVTLVNDLTTRVWTDTTNRAYVESAGGSGYRTGAWFVRQTVNNIANSASEIGEWPVFQSALATRHMIDFYTMVYADSRLPTQIKAEVDRAIATSGPLTTGEAGNNSNLTWSYQSVTYTFPTERYGHEYFYRKDPGRPGGFSSYTLPMWAPAFAFVHKYYGGTASDGETYLKWVERAANVAIVHHAMSGANGGSLTWSWKVFGEIMSGIATAAYFLSLPGQPQGPATLRTPTSYSDWSL